LNNIAGNTRIIKIAQVIVDEMLNRGNAENIRSYQFDQDEQLQNVLLQPTLNKLLDLQKNGQEKLLKTIAENIISELYRNQLIANYPNIKKASLDFARIYEVMVKGHGIGFWKVREVGDGYAIFQENTPFPLEFNKGLLTGIANIYNAVGAIANLNSESNNKTYNEINLVWMRNLLDSTMLKKD
jgi:hypothetical protein